MLSGKSEMKPVERKRVSGKNKVARALDQMQLTVRDDLKDAFMTTMVGPPMITCSAIISEDNNGRIVYLDDLHIQMVIFSCEADFYAHLRNSRETEKRQRATYWTPPRKT